MRLKAILFTLLLTLGLLGNAVAAELKIEGSTTVAPIIQIAIEKYMAAHPDVKIAMSGTGSGDGIKALIEGHIDIAMASRKIKDKEVTLAGENGVNPVELVIAGDALLPVVHPSNPVGDLSKDQLKAIYAGEITNWKDVGGEDKEMAVHTRESSSGTYATWNGKILGKGDDAPRLTPDAQSVSSNGAMAAAVANNPNGIGYIGIGYLDDSLKAVAVGGVLGSGETVSNGTYPLGRTLQLYTNGEPSGEIKAFMDWLLTDEGKACVAEAGFLNL